MDILFEISERLIRGLSTHFQRYLSQKIEWDNRLVEIKGARGTGKTTLMLQRAKELQKKHLVLYTSLDLPYFYTNSIFDLADTFYKSGGNYLFLDEIHKYPNVKLGQDWSNELKAIYDSFPELKIVYSSSSLLHLYKGNGDLSRRKVSYELYGLSYREFLNFQYWEKFEAVPLSELLSNHIQIAREINEKIKPLANFNEYLQIGYYPFFKESKSNYPARLLNIINLIIESDIPAVASAPSENTEKLKKLLGAISSTVPYTPNIKALSNHLSIADYRTTLKYLNLLEHGGLIKQLSANSIGNKILQKPDKIYIQNTNLLHVLAPKNTETGTIRETFFYNQLLTEHQVTYPKIGDFFIDQHILFEVGGKSKTQKQLESYEGEKYIVADNIEIGFGNKVPLWMFGFLY
ncbi:MAG: ATP-binding protein [Bacteroidia bacterium]|nr:ATP-binding protein [Bacteroidia bacterium]